MDGPTVVVGWWRSADPKVSAVGVWGFNAEQKRWSCITKLDLDDSRGGFAEVCIRICMCVCMYIQIVWLGRNTGGCITKLYLHDSYAKTCKGMYCVCTVYVCLQRRVKVCTVCAYMYVYLHVYVYVYGWGRFLHLS